MVTESFWLQAVRDYVDIKKKEKKKGWYTLKHIILLISKIPFPKKNKKIKKSIGQYPFKCSEPVEPAEYVAL